MKARQHSPPGKKCLISLWACYKQGGSVSTRRACQEVALLLRRQNGEGMMVLPRTQANYKGIAFWNGHLWVQRGTYGKQAGFIAKHSVGITYWRGLVPTLACLVLMAPIQQFVQPRYEANFTSNSADPFWGMRFCPWEKELTYCILPGSIFLYQFLLFCISGMFIAAVQQATRTHLLNMDLNPQICFH